MAKNTPGDRDSSPDMEIERDHKPIVIRNSTDLQRLKLEKLMKNPEKEVIIPERPKERGVPVVPDFVRNVMGSSAGAGSGEFHVYRHLRRKEYARQRYMKEKGEREKLDNEYHAKLEENRRKAEERTAKKRQKRLKKKQKMKKKPKLGSKSSQSEATDSSSSEEVESEECEKKNEEQTPSEDSKPTKEENTEDRKEGGKEDAPKETPDNTNDEIK
ncbi:PRKR-interacting protein 1 homolog [Tribolium castaneum]|uniref:PRKR-interacting protein 1 homolog n=1 Tax=Tribolium castaneum TaxID=7070 RepID=UPI0030FE0FAA